MLGFGRSGALIGLGIGLVCLLAGVVFVLPMTSAFGAFDMFGVMVGNLGYPTVEIIGPIGEAMRAFGLIWLAVSVAIIVVSTAFLVAARFGRSKGAAATPPNETTLRSLDRLHADGLPTDAVEAKRAEAIRRA